MLCRCCLKLAVATFVVAGLSNPAAAQTEPPKPVTGANWKQAFKFNSNYLKQFVYSYYARPIWIGKTDSFAYSYRTSKGLAYYRVDPAKKSKKPLFDHTKLAGQLSQQSRIPVDPNLMTLSSLKIDAKGTKINFVYEKYRYEYDLKKEKLKKLGKSKTSSRYAQALARLEQMKKSGRISQQMYDRYKKYYEDRMKRSPKEPEPYESIDDPQQKKKTTIAKKPTAKKKTTRSYRSYAPDRKRYVYAHEHNLYLVTIGKNRKRTTTQLSKDGVENYSFGGRSTSSSSRSRRTRRSRISWSKDSKAFYAYRSDSRGIKELWLVNSLAQPRPTLTKYGYPMPGEPAIRKSELHYYHRDSNKLKRVEPRWKDESYLYVTWGKNGEELRFLRLDRLRRNYEYCILNTKTGESKCLIDEGFENAIAHYQSPRYLKSGDEFIWWSERTGWGHFYLYSRDGKLKNVITSGAWRASRIVSLDEKNRKLYFYGNAREGGNVYHNHLYCVGLDGKNLKLLTPGKAHHGVTLSPTKRFVVDNCSSIDSIPKTVLRDTAGRTVMELEKMDLSNLEKTGWRRPETFVVKAADGVTNLYGNMWKPFDFDPNKKYPIIAYVYPGPQQEGVRHTFTALSSRQQLAQLGFIVIQVGHRGGSPERSKAYHRHSYFNMRDFGLPDKKVAIEQLAERYSFIDIDRIGIYGHSGGGFMSAAAMLQKPYNEFFKAAVASAGNHDNNIYNNSWAERYHGLREVPVSVAKKTTGSTAKTQAKKQPESRLSLRESAPASIRDFRQSPERRAFFRGAKDDFDLPADMDPWDRSEVIRIARARRAVKAAKPKSRKRKAVVAVKPKRKKSAMTQAAKKAKTKKKVVAKKKTPTKFEIKVPTNAELAANLKGHLMLVHGEVDNNVHPANTLRLVDALIKANKRFDMLILPGQRHGFGSAQKYFEQRMWEFFADHLLHDRHTGADIFDKKQLNRQRVR